MPLHKKKKLVQTKISLASAASLKAKARTVNEEVGADQYHDAGRPAWLCAPTNTARLTDN